MAFLPENVGNAAFVSERSVLPALFDALCQSNDRGTALFPNNLPEMVSS